MLGASRVADSIPFSNQISHIEFQSQFPDTLFLLIGGHYGSWTLHLRTLHLRMLFLRYLIFGDFTFWMLHLRVVSPSGSYTFGNFTFWMLHLRDVSPSGCFTFGQLHLLNLHHLWTFHLRTSSETVEGEILRSCNVPKV